MVRYWVIAPYRNQRIEENDRSWHPDAFETAWRYDLANSVISIGWYELGDLTGVPRNEIRRRYVQKFEDECAREYINLQRFWHDISPGDRIIARFGVKKIVGLGTGIGLPYYDLIKGEEWTGGLPINPHLSFLPVNWKSLEGFEFRNSVFQRFAVSELKREHKSWPQIEAVLDRVWDMV